MVCAAAIAVSGVIVEQASAQTQSVWDGGSSGGSQGVYTAANWVGNELPSTGDTLIFSDRNGTDALRVIGSSVSASPTGSIFFATTTFDTTVQRPFFSSLIFGSDTTSRLPATLSFLSGGASGTANQTLTLTGDSSGNYISMQASATGTVRIDRVNNGTLTLALQGAGAFNVVSPTGVLELEANLTGTTGLVKTGAGTVYINTSSTTAPFQTFTGGVDIREGTLRTELSTGLGPTSNSVTIRNGALQFDSTGTVPAAREFFLTDANSTFLYTNTGLTIAGNMSGTGALNKTGSGTLSVSGTNSFTGGVKVQAGTLFLNSPLPATAEMTVAPGATLGGNSTYGAANIRVGGTIYPGTSSAVGTFTTSGNVILSNGSSFGTYRTTFSTGSTTGAHDILAVGGTFDITGGTLRLDSLNSAGDASYILASYGTLTGGTFANVTGLVGGYTLDYNYLGTGQIALVRGNTTLFFNGSNNADFGNAPNFTTDAAGANATTQTPTASADVTFASNGLSNTANYATTIAATTYVNSLTFANAAPTSISQLNAGTGSLVIRATGINYAAGTGITVNAGAGAVTINTPVTPSSSQTWTNNSTNPLAVTGAVAVGSSVTLTLAGAGSTTLSGLVSGSGALTVKGTASLTAANTYLGTTTVDATAAVLTVKTNGSGGLAAAPLITGPGGADLRNGTVVFDYSGDSSPLSTIRNLLKASFDEAGTPGIMETGQIRSSTASLTRGLGYKDNGTGAVTVRATLFGDADLDGGVSINDFNALAGSFGAGSGKVWTDGDFDYDGGVSINDFNLLAGGFGQSVPPNSELWAGLLAFAAAHNDLEAFAAITGVPEPTSLAVIAAGSTLGLRRRRR